MAICSILCFIKSVNDTEPPQSLAQPHNTPMILSNRGHIKFFKLFTVIDQAMIALEGSLKMKRSERQIKIYVPRFSIKYYGNVKTEI